MGKNLLRGTIPVVLGLAVLIAGCGRQESRPSDPRTTAATVQNEVVVASTPITTITAASQTVELNQEKAALISTPVDPSSKNKAIQLALRNANFYSGEIDGKIGPKTREAVKQFQLSKSLTADGIVGPRTWMALKAYLPEEQNSEGKR